MMNVRADGGDREKADWIRRVLGVEIPHTADGGPATKAHEGVGAKVKFAMQALTDRIQQAIQNAPDRGGKLTTAVAAFDGALKDSDTELAERLLKSITAEVDRVIAAGPRVHGGTIAYDQLLMDWTSARDAVATDLRTLEEAVLKDFAGAPNLEDVRVRLRKLDQILGAFGSDLQDKIGEAMKAPAASRPQIHTDAIDIIGRYKTYVDGDSFVAAIDANPYMTVKIKTRLSAVLESLGKALAA